MSISSASMMIFQWKFVETKWMCRTCKWRQVMLHTTWRRIYNIIRYLQRVPTTLWNHFSILQESLQGKESNISYLYTDPQMCNFVESNIKFISLYMQPNLHLAKSPAYLPPKVRSLLCSYNKFSLQSFWLIHLQLVVF